MKKSLTFLSKFLNEELYLLKEDRLGYTLSGGGQEADEPGIEEKTIEYEGSNLKGVMVIIEDGLNESETKLLDNVLDSVQLSRDDVALIMQKGSTDELARKVKSIDASKIISFGITTGKSRFLDIQAKYAPTTVEGKIVILADSLRLLNQNVDLKRKLWDSLKEAF